MAACSHQKYPYFFLLLGKGAPASILAIVEGQYVLLTARGRLSPHSSQPDCYLCRSMRTIVCRPVEFAAFTSN